MGRLLTAVFTNFRDSKVLLSCPLAMAMEECGQLRVQVSGRRQENLEQWEILVVQEMWFHSLDPILTSFDINQCSVVVSMKLTGLNVLPEMVALQLSSGEGTPADPKQRVFPFTVYPHESLDQVRIVESAARLT